MAKSRTKYQIKPADKVFAEFSVSRQRKIEKRAAELLAERADGQGRVRRSSDEGERDR